MTAALCSAALAALAVSTCGCFAETARSQTPHSDILIMNMKVAEEQATVITWMSERYGVDLNVKWEHCGQENSYFTTAGMQIVLCTEMDKKPLTALFFAAHEAAHGITWKLAHMLDEGSADEVAELALIDMGRVDAIRAAAIYWSLEEQWGTGTDSHPTHAYRSKQLTCIADGAEGKGDPGCGELYRSTRLRWEWRLEVPGAAN